MTKKRATTEIGDYYKDGIGTERCAECLMTKGEAHTDVCTIGIREAWQAARPPAPSPARTRMTELLPPDTMLYVHDIKPRQEQAKEETKKIIVIAFKLQPFTAAMARLMGVHDRLFDTADKPLDDIVTISLGLKSVPLYDILWRTALDGPIGLHLEDVKVTPTLSVRRDKEGPVYAASFDASVLYPAADDLLTILHAYTEARYVTFVPSQAKLPMEGEVVDQASPEAPDA